MYKFSIDTDTGCDDKRLCCFAGGLQENIECDFEPVTLSPAPMVLMIDSAPATGVSKNLTSRSAWFVQSLPSLCVHNRVEFYAFSSSGVAVYTKKNISSTQSIMLLAFSDAPPI